MYYDLFLPFPVPDTAPKKKKDKGKGKAVVEGEQRPTDCWAGLSAFDKTNVARSVALAGHLGYNVVAHTVSAEQGNHVTPCPFGSVDQRILPYPSLDPRFAEASSQPQSLIQVTRYHMRLDDGKVHPVTASNTAALGEYDILSAYVGSDKALQVACGDLANPGPNQISIITVPLHERPYHFRLNRKQIKQAQRNGVVFEILYAAGLFPTRSTSDETARRFRQNFLTNARELVRITGGKGIILSSGPGGSDESQRGPLDVVNLATILGVPANLAKDALSATPKRILLNAQARRTYKGVVGVPVVGVEEEETATETATAEPAEPTAVLVEKSTPSTFKKRPSSTADSTPKKKTKK